MAHFLLYQVATLKLYKLIPLVFLLKTCEGGFHTDSSDALKINNEFNITLLPGVLEQILAIANFHQMDL